MVESILNMMSIDFYFGEYFVQFVGSNGNAIVHELLAMWVSYRALVNAVVYS